MRSFSKAGLCLESQSMREAREPKNRIRKAHPVGQARVPAARNRSRAMTRNRKMNSPTSNFRLIDICHLFSQQARVHPAAPEMRTFLVERVVIALPPFLAERNFHKCFLPP